MPVLDIEESSLTSLLDDIHRVYGYDFHHYAKASLRRRIANAINTYQLSDITELHQNIMQNRDVFNRFLDLLCVTVTEMFRDPHVFEGLRKKVIPLLRTYPFINVWHAGCATGEEVYSLAIMLTEEGLYDRTRIYATDTNPSSIASARELILPLHRVQQFTMNYQKAGGTRSFSSYYHARYGYAKMCSALMDNVVFSTHNLATDDSFGEMHLILCRNVLIYFDEYLQAKVLALFDRSLIRNGFLCLGSKESLRTAPQAAWFKPIDTKFKIYQKNEVTAG